MKRYFILLIFVLMALPILAQDTITKKDGTKLITKILEVSPSEVKYKKYSNPEGPTFILPTKDILIVTYQTGETETFTTQTETQQQTQAVPQTKQVSQAPFSIPKYRIIKDLFDRKTYTQFSSDKYSPGWCGFASFVIPGLGQAIENEWGRALGFFFGNVACNLFLYYNTLLGYETREDKFQFGTGAFLVIGLTINICSVVDAVRIAKVKNLWCNQMLSHIESINISPTFSYLPTNDHSPVFGVNMCISF